MTKKFSIDDFLRNQQEDKVKDSVNNIEIISNDIVEALRERVGEEPDRDQLFDCVMACITVARSICVQGMPPEKIKEFFQKIADTM